MKISIVIPCYNEKATVEAVIHAVEQVDLGAMQKEILCIDDGSTDGTRAILLRLGEEGRCTVLLHDHNQGKGAALRTGFAQATGDIVLVQDADLEYDPEDYPRLIAPILERECHVVYGSRERHDANRAHSGWSFYAGGLFLTWFTNLLYGSHLTDEPTCYKVFDAALLHSIPLICKRFEFCPEVTAKILRRGEKIIEVPISYRPRRTKEGKKIRFRDGLEAMWTLVRYRFFERNTELKNR